MRRWAGGGHPVVLLIWAVQVVLQSARLCVAAPLCSISLSMTMHDPAAHPLFMCTCGTQSILNLDHWIFLTRDVSVARTGS
jgi:hypothetical protein